MTMFKVLATIFVLSIIDSSCTNIGPIACPLQWQTLYSDTSMPITAVATQSKKHYVAKQVTPKESIGRIEVTDDLCGIAVVPENNTVQEISVFQILLNPLNCEVSWVNKADSRIPALGVVAGTQFVGRVNTKEALLPGSILDNTMNYIDEDMQMKTTTTYFTLISYSKGLQLELTNFVFQDIGPPSNAFFGSDVVNNTADVDIIHTITHSKTVIESVTITETESTTSTWSLSVGITAKFEVKVKNTDIGVSLGFGFDFSKSNMEGTEKSITNSKTKEISVSRSIFVPPRTSVVACSSIQSLDNVQIKYSCLASYRATGLNGTEILSYILEDFPNAKAIGDAAVVETNGAITGSLPVSTKFKVLPANSLQLCD